MKSLSVKHLLARKVAGGNVTVAGWIRTARHGKGFSFLEINDGSCLANIQVIADAALPEYDETIKHLSTGASVRVEGTLVDSPGKKQRFEVHATHVHLYGAAPEYPLQKKGHSMEFLRSIAHLRPRSNTFGAVFRVRSQMACAIHRFFWRRGFVYLNSPIITASDCEGAGAMFRVTTLDPADPPRNESRDVDYGQDFFGKPAYLTVSGQLAAETAALALSRVYTFGPTFRAENSNTTRHLAEFWMIEPEVAFHDLVDNMDLAEEFLKEIFRHLMRHCHEDLVFFNERIDKSVLATVTQVIEKEFVRMTYTEAISVLQKSKTSFEFPVEWGCDLQSEHERYLTEEHVGRPVIVTNYPKEIKAFYMRLDDDERTVAAMDVLVPRIGEIIGGSQREERLDVLERRIGEMNLPVEDYQWYLETRKFGSVPHAGFGLGLERTIQFATGMSNVRDVIPFPRTPGSADF